MHYWRLRGIEENGMLQPLGRGLLSRIESNSSGKADCPREPTRRMWRGMPCPQTRWRTVFIYQSWQCPRRRFTVLQDVRFPVPRLRSYWPCKQMGFQCRVEETFKDRSSFRGMTHFRTLLINRAWALQTPAQCEFWNLLTSFT